MSKGIPNWIPKDHGDLVGSPLLLCHSDLLTRWSSEIVPLSDERKNPFVLHLKGDSAVVGDASVWESFQQLINGNMSFVSSTIMFGAENIECKCCTKRDCTAKASRKQWDCGGPIRSVFMLFFYPMARVSLGFVKSHEFWAPRRRISIWTDLEFHLWSYWTHRTQRIHVGSIYTRAPNNDQILTHLIASIQILISHLISRCKFLPECEIHQDQEYVMFSGIQ